MELNDLLAARDIDPAAVLVFRHSPIGPQLRKVLPWLAATRPEVFNAYQQAHWVRTEKALTRAQYVVSCIGHTPREALFVGVYEVSGWKPVSVDEFWQIPGNAVLKDLGMTGINDDRPSTLWFNLDLTEDYAHWKGKLVLEWSGLERSWYRWAAALLTLEWTPVTYTNVSESSINSGVRTSWSSTRIFRKRQGGVRVINYLEKPWFPHSDG